VAQLVWIQEDLAKFCYQPDMKILQNLRFLLCFGFLVEPTCFFQFFGYQILMKNSKILENLVKFTLIFAQSPSGKKSPKKQAD
jgi:hypothetical protein